MTTIETLNAALVHSGCFCTLEKQTVVKAASELSALQKENAELKSVAERQMNLLSGAAKPSVELTEEIDSLRTQNRELREACKLSQIALKEYDLLVANGDFYFNCKCHKSGPAQQAINKALALQPEKI